MKKVSIITINRNNANGLRATAESIISQTFLSEVEWIVIDGASDDGSVDVIQEYKSYIDYWVSEADAGIYAAMNKGILAAGGEYVIFRNSGDLMYNDKVIENFIKHPAYGRYDHCSGITNVVRNGRLWYLFYPPKNLTIDEFYRWSMPHASTFIKRSRFKDSLYNQSMKISADTVFAFVDIMTKNASYTALDFMVCTFEATGVSSRAENQRIGLEERDNGFRECMPAGLYENMSYMFRHVSSRERRLIHYTWSRTWEFKILCYVAFFLSIPSRLLVYITKERNKH